MTSWTQTGSNGVYTRPPMLRPPPLPCMFTVLCPWKLEGGKWNEKIVKWHTQCMLITWTRSMELTYFLDPHHGLPRLLSSKHQADPFIQVCASVKERSIWLFLEPYFNHILIFPLSRTDPALVFFVLYFPKMLYHFILEVKNQLKNQFWSTPSSCGISSFRKWTDWIPMKISAA